MHDGAVDIECAHEIQTYRSFMRQFRRRILKTRSKGFNKKSSEKFYFAHVLETLHNLRDKHFESSGLEKVRYLHNFVLLATLLYVRGMPGRSK